MGIRRRAELRRRLVSRSRTRPVRALHPRIRADAVHEHAREAMAKL
jgi:hypothetical protein